MLAYVYPASVPVFAFFSSTQSGRDKGCCVLCLFLIDDWGRAGYGAVKEGLLEPKCFWKSCVLERGHVGETLLLLASEVAPCGCDAWALLCDRIHHVMKR